MKKDQKQGHSIGQRLLAIRKVLKLSQLDFAKSLKISDSYVSAIEVGNVTPSYDYLIKLIHCYDVDLNYLFFGEGSFPTMTPKASVKIKIDPEKLDIIDTIDQLMFFLKKSSVFRSAMLLEGAKFFFENKDMVLKSMQED
jgi:transcriptional regulator with XRE-family HTH domain